MKLLEILLEKADRAGIPYVSWKNNHELEAYLEGRGDLDLFVAPDHRTAFLSLAMREGWMQLENPVAEFPSVSHLYRAG